MVILLSICMNPAGADDTFFSALRLASFEGSPIQKTTDTSRHVPEDIEIAHYTTYMELLGCS